MPKYECSRQVECLITIEAENDIDLQRQLGRRFADADTLVEEADAVVFGDYWQVIEVDPPQERGILTFTDEAIMHHVKTAPEPWVED